MKRLASLGLFAFIVSTLAVFLWAWQSLTTAPPRAQGSFDSERARATLNRLLAEEAPHPTGSPENQRVRERIVETLKGAGYDPEVRAAFQCAPPDKAPGCTQIENVVAVLNGTGDGQAILATAHYDSVPAGPGVGDDGVGVAVMLELARALRTRPPGRNDVIFLFTDGEETGLRGSLAFAARDPRMTRVGLVVNVEARGDTGPAIMFETGRGNDRLISRFRDLVAAPVSNSLAYEIYRLLPNDTDFSTYKRLGLSGYNFAMIGSAARYHTPKDTLAMLDPNSLRHHGEQVSALIGALREEDLAGLRSESDASYFDLFGRALVVWPASRNLPLALASLALMVGLFVKRRSDLTAKAMAWSACALLLLPLVLFALGWCLSFPLGIWPEVHGLDHPAPWPARIALLGATIAVSALCARLLVRRASPTSMVLMAWVLLAVLAVACSATLPGAAYALLWPAVLFATLGWLVALFAPSHALRVASLAGFVMMAMFWTGHMLALDAVAGFPMSQFKLLALFPLAFALVSLLASHTPLPTLAVATTFAALAMAATVASLQTGYRPEHPRPLNLVYYEDADANEASWLVQDTPIDRAFMQQAGFPLAPSNFELAGVVPASGFRRAALKAGLPAPSLEVLRREVDGDTVRLVGRIHSVRSGFMFGLAIPQGSAIRSVSVEGETLVSAERLAGAQPVWARLYGTADRPLAIVIAYRKDARARVALFERSALPNTAEAQGLVRLRPLSASPVHLGDGAFVFRMLDLPALPPAAP